MNFRFRASALGLLVGTVLVLAGCSKSPLSPGSPSGTASAPPIVSFDSDGAVSYVGAPVGDQVADPMKAGGVTPRAVSSSSVIDGNRGGSVRAGRFSVRLPAGAFVGPATVTVSMQDSTVMICELSITPQAANKFKNSAELTADLSSPDVVDASAFTMYWYDPAKADWVNLFAKSRVNGSNVTTTLDHFSTYGAGKAGW